MMAGSKDRVPSRCLNKLLGIPVMKSMRETITMRKWVGALLVAAAGVLVGEMAQAFNLQSLNYASLPGNKLEVRLGFDQSTPEGRSYSIEKPARIALDLVGANNGLEARNHNLGTGNARSITVVEAKDRTRLIVNLAQLTGYDTHVEGNELVLTLGVDNQTANVFEPAADDKAPASRSNQVSQIDFRRGETGE